MARLRVLGENPPPPRGSGENQLRELRDYLTRLKDELEFLLTHLGEDNLDGELTAYVKQIDTQAGKIETQDEEISSINAALAGKQDTLTFDDSPTSGSDNPVKSGGIYTALAGKGDADRFIVMDTDYVVLSNATWQTWSGGNLFGIEMPITDLPAGYRPVAATLTRFVNWPSGAHFVPYVGYSSGTIDVFSDTAQANVGHARLMLRVVLEKVV